MDVFRAFRTAAITKRDPAWKKTIPHDPSKRDDVKRVVEGQYTSLLKLWREVNCSERYLLLKHGDLLQERICGNFIQPELQKTLVLPLHHSFNIIPLRRILGDGFHSILNSYISFCNVSSSECTKCIHPSHWPWNEKNVTVTYLARDLPRGCPGKNCYARFLLHM